MKRNFVDVWKHVALYAEKDGVPHIFELSGVDHIEDVTDKNQLRPNINALLNETTLSTNALLFYTAAFCYFNENAAAKTLEKFDLPQIAGRMITNAGLDYERKKILSELMLSYQGW